MRERTARDLLVCIALLVGCGPPSSPLAVADAGPGRAAGSAPVTGVVVATVDGEPIALADVADVARATGLTPLEALRRIEDEALLYEAAVRGGVASSAEDDRTVRRAMVQAYLDAEIETQITPASLSSDIVAARRTRDAALFAQPERRSSTHVLLRRRGGSEEDDGDAAAATLAAMERFAARVSSELRAQADPAGVVHRYGDENAAGRAFEIVVEDLPPARRAGDVDDAFAQALFALTNAGGVTEPITTSFGIHVVVLTEIVPAWSAEEDEVLTIIRRQLAVEARAVALVALEDRLLTAHPPALNSVAIERLLDADLEALTP